MAGVSFKQNAIEMTATSSLQANFCLASSEMNTKSVGQQINIVAGALSQSAQGLQEIGQARQALAAQLDGGAVDIAPQAGGPAGGGSMLTSVGIGATLTAINPALGAGYFAVDAVKSGINFAMNALGGPNHAGLDHAAISGGTSTLSKSLSDAKNDDVYVDTMGDSWGQDGYLVAQNSVSQASAPDPKAEQRQANAAKTIDLLGEDEVREQLAGVSSIEKRLLQQAGAAVEFAENNFGVTLPGLSANEAELEPTKPTPPRMAMVGAPSVGLG